MPFATCPRFTKDYLQATTVVPSLFLPLCNCMSSFWLDACKRASNKSQQTLLDAVYASNSATIAAYCVSLFAGGSMFCLWLRLDADARRQRRIWRMFGWYCGLMLCASCFGIVAWVSHMISYVSLWNSAFATSVDEKIRLSTIDSTWNAAHLVTFPIEMLCSSLAQLMVLDRMSELAVPEGDAIHKRWIVGRRFVIAIVILGCATFFAANVTAAVHYQKSAEAYRTSLLFKAANDGKKFEEYDALAYKEEAVVISAEPVQRLSEVAVLLSIVAVFLLAGVILVRRVRDALRAVDSMFGEKSQSPDLAAAMAEGRRLLAAAMAEGRRLQLKILSTTVFVFVSFSMRSALATMIALAWSLRDYGSDNGKTCAAVTSDCDASCCQCYNTYTFITVWAGSTPEFRPTIVLFSSPLTLLVLLWGMTTDRIWKRLKPDEQETSLHPL